MKPWLSLFLSGWITNSAFRSLQQDMLGKEKCLAMYEAAWVTPWITVPVALLMLWMAWVFLTHSRRELGQ